jgi:hypothetical protein
VPGRFTTGFAVLEPETILGPVHAYNTSVLVVMAVSVVLLIEPQGIIALAARLKLGAATLLSTVYCTATEQEVEISVTTTE